MSIPKKRDRAYVRIITFDRKDRQRFEEFIQTLPPGRLMDNIVESGGNQCLVCIRLKKEELLFVELSFNISVRKPRPVMIKNRYGFNAWKTI